jgi:hypothetical protein
MIPTREGDVICKEPSNHTAWVVHEPISSVNDEKYGCEVWLTNNNVSSIKRCDNNLLLTGGTIQENYTVVKQRAQED